MLCFAPCNNSFATQLQHLLSCLLRIVTLAFLCRYDSILRICYGLGILLQHQSWNHVIIWTPPKTKYTIAWLSICHFCIAIVLFLQEENRISVKRRTFCFLLIRLLWHRAAAASKPKKPQMEKANRGYTQY